MLQVRAERCVRAVETLRATSLQWEPQQQFGAVSHPIHTKYSPTS